MNAMVLTAKRQNEQQKHACEKREFVMPFQICGKPGLIHDWILFRP